MGIWGGAVQHDHGSIAQGGQVTACDCVSLFQSIFSTTSPSTEEIPGTEAILNVSLNRRIFAFLTSIVQRTIAGAPGSGEIRLFVYTSPGGVMVDTNVVSRCFYQDLSVSYPCNFSMATDVLDGNQAYRCVLTYQGSFGTNLIINMRVAYLEHPSG